MALFRKQKTDSQIKKGAVQSDIDPTLARQIHVMPQRFYVAPKKSRSGLIIIICVGLVLIGGLAIAALYLNEDLKNNIAPSVNVNATAPTTNSTPVVNGNSNASQNQNTAVINPLVSTTTATTTDTNTNSQVVTSTPSIGNTNTNTSSTMGSSQLIPFPSSADSDSDGLTDAEEQLYGTNPNNPDTDQDGYSDGSELLNGYDPTKKGATLAQSGLFTVYATSQYSIMYPTRWTVQERDPQRSEVLFTAGTGEFVEVLVMPNTSRLPLDAWYRAQYPAIDFSKVTQVKINNTAGLRSPDVLSYYLTAPNDTTTVYLINYNAGSFSQANFLTTFNVMAKSFKLK